MKTLFPGLTQLHPTYVILSSAFCLCVTLSPAFVCAQINRSERPARSTESEAKKTSDAPAKTAQPAASPNRDSQTSDRTQSPTSTQRSDRRETADSSRPTVSSASRNRYKKTKESDDSLDPIGTFGTARYSPYVLFPDVYGSSRPPIYIPYPYPYPTPNLPPNSSESQSRFYSLYLYCDDMSGVTYTDTSAVFREKIRTIYTPSPVFKGKELVGWKNLGVKQYDEDRLAEDKAYKLGDDEPDAALNLAVRHIAESWRTGDPSPLAEHLLRKSRLAIILNGSYQYSMEAGDFIALTATAYSSAANLQFIPDHLIRKSDKIFVLTGRHIYKDSADENRTVYFSYTLQFSKDIYLLTQLSTAPDRL